jgi:hypothetical protein
MKAEIKPRMNLKSRIPLETVVSLQSQNSQFTTPVLFLIYRRLDTAKQVFSVIRQIKPARFFIAANGPCLTIPAEAEQCNAVRKYVLDNIDWDCEVKTLFRNENLGCGKSIFSAITWFFERVEQGIILEDDSVPSMSFFPYCEELLEKYKDNDRIYHITGHNPLGHTKNTYGYYFARIEHCWSWATWKRAWDKYSYDMKGLDAFIKEKRINHIFRRKCDREYWLRMFKQTEKNEIDTWDYQWTYAIFKNNGICINPSKNLISNIGFGSDSTHTTDVNSIYNNQRRYDMTIIKHPKHIRINNHTINKINRIDFGIETWLKKKYKRNKQRCIKFLKLCRLFFFNRDKTPE